MRQGLIHIYAGDGKGKTTAAVGLAIRAIGHKNRVCYAYFHKNPEKYGFGEIAILKNLGAEIIGIAEGHPLFNKNIDKESHRMKTQKGFDELVEQVNKKKINLLVMDEVLGSVQSGFLEEEKLLEFITHKPEHMELVMTGRGATDRLMEKADYVSSINKIKHPYDEGIKAQKGIEY